MKSRLYFLDNLRTFLIFLVVVLHSGLVYESVLESSWIVVDPDKANNLGLLRMYLDIFVMFSLFYVSGYFGYPSIKSKSVFNFIKTKASRLMVPWLVGVLFIIPLYKVLFLYSRGLPQESWYTYFHIFQRADGDPYFFADNPVQNWLWFLPVLFTFQMIYLLMVYYGLSLKNTSIKLMVGVVVIIGLLYSISVSQLDLVGWHHSAIFHFQRERLLPYFLVFLLGALSYHQKVFTDGKLNKKMYIWSNVALTPLLAVFTIVALNLFFNIIDPGRNHFFISPVVDTSVYYLFFLLSMLAFLYILIYTFYQYFDKYGKLLNILSTNSYYVYIVHVVVIGAMAIPLLSVDLNPVFKFIILAISSYMVSNVLVYLYKKYFEVPLSQDWIRILLLGLAVFVAISVFRNQSYLEGQSNSRSKIGYSTIHEETMRGNVEAIDFFINNGTDLNAIEEVGGSSPLILASMFDRYDVCQALIEAGAAIDQTNNDGSTALFTAAFFGRTDIVRLLVEKGADPSIKNNVGMTALESVRLPMENLKGIYEYFINSFEPLGFDLNLDSLESKRKEVASILTDY